jgi:hypothetical protein
MKLDRGDRLEGTLEIAMLVSSLILSHKKMIKITS